jgi:hypothetical protein
MSCSRNLRSSGSPRNLHRALAATAELVDVSGNARAVTTIPGEKGSPEEAMWEALRSNLKILFAAKLTRLRDSEYPVGLARYSESF